MKLAPFIVGIMCFLSSFILFYTKDFYVAEAVNSSTQAMLNLFFPIFLIGGFVFTFIGIGTR